MDKTDNIAKSAEVDSDQLRKRQRNRFAQQKYRKNLKLHIQHLESRAAAAEQLFSSIPATNVGLYNVPVQPHHFPNNLVGSTNHAQEADYGTAGNSAVQVYHHRSRERPNLNENYPVLPSDAELLVSQSYEDVFDTTNSYQMLPAPTEELRSRPISVHGVDQRENLIGDLGSNDSFDLDARMGGAETVKSSNLACSPDDGPRVVGKSPQLEEEPEMESRIQYILGHIEKAGFDAPDSFISCYYTGKFKQRSKVRSAQENSRSKGLPQVLEDLRSQIGLWPVRESRGYKDIIVQSASDLIAQEFERLERKKYHCEIELSRNLSMTSETLGEDASADRLRSIAAELKVILRDELPDLFAFTTGISAKETQSEMMHLFVTTMQVMAAADDEPCQEALDWVLSRQSSPAGRRASTAPFTNGYGDDGTDKSIRVK